MVREEAYYLCHYSRSVEFCARLCLRIFELFCELQDGRMRMVKEVCEMLIESLTGTCSPLKYQLCVCPLLRLADIQRG